jgi:spectinomycin phosphotransferase
MMGDLSNGRNERWFYQGYGKTRINLEAKVYYRYERIIQDIAEFCKQLLLTDAGGDDREQAYKFFTSNFAPGGELEAARRLDERLNN